MCSMFWEIFEVHYMSVGQKLAKLKICSTGVIFLSLHNLEAAPEETMKVRMLIKSSDESLGPYLFGKIGVLEFLRSHSWYTRGGSHEPLPLPGTVPQKSPPLIGLTWLNMMEMNVISEKKTTNIMINKGNNKHMWQLCAAMMSWVGCLLKDSELFILFAENSHILCKISVIPVLLTHTVWSVNDRFPVGFL